ncbi:MAG: transposase [Dehalococcoidia bacterium]|nr:transposase [Dehalococcoidia bacterium]MBM2832672.1 transposase [Dehalococcoidia bacterium]
MSKTFRPYEPDQEFLMPASMREWLPSGHLAYFVSDLVDSLDLSSIMERYTDEERGYPPYHPQMMVKVLLYAYCVGVPSSRKIAKRLEEDIAFRVLAANNTPDFRTISDFRKNHLQALAALFLEVLKLCQKAGLVKLGHVSLDGTKIMANASKHKAMSYKRMKEEEARLNAEIQDLLKKAEAVDEEEDRRYGKSKRGDELPKELAFREGRLKKIKEARVALEAEARAEVEQTQGTGKKTTGVPEDKAQRNFTDPESHIMPAPGGKHFVQAYNAQAAVDSAHQVIVAADVTDQPSDKGQAVPMMKQVKANTGQLPRQMSADAGYFSSDAVKDLTADGIDVYMPPDRMPHAYKMPAAPRGRIPKGLSIVDRMRRKLRTKQGRKRYGLRKELPEPVFGQIKQARGFRQFLLRGRVKVRCEWRFICTGHNMLKLFGARNSGLLGQEFWSQTSPA